MLIVALPEAPWLSARKCADGATKAETYMASETERAYLARISPSPRGKPSTCARVMWGLYTVIENKVPSQRIGYKELRDSGHAGIY